MIKWNNHLFLSRYLQQRWRMTSSAAWWPWSDQSPSVYSRLMKNVPHQRQYCSWSDFSDIWTSTGLSPLIWRNRQQVIAPLPHGYNFSCIRLLVRICTDYRSPDCKATQGASQGMFPASGEISASLASATFYYYCWRLCGVVIFAKRIGVIATDSMTVKHQNGEASCLVWNERFISKRRLVYNGLK